MKERLKKHLPRPLFLFGKGGWVALQLLIEFFRIAGEFFRHKKKVCSGSVFLWLAHPGSVGGTELQIEIIAENLKGAVVLLSGIVEEGRENLFIKRLKKKNIPVLYLGLRPFATRVGVLFLRWMRGKGAVSHFFNPAAALFAPQLKKGGFKVFYMETGMPVKGGGWDILSSLIGDFECVTSVSEAGLRRIKELFGYKGASRVIPSMIHPFSRWDRRDSGLFSVLYFGRLTPLKGVDLLIRSFLKLLERVPEARLSIVGSGEEMGRLRRLALSERITFFGWLERGELKVHLEGAHVVCLPSDSEGLPSSILEAMSMGIPVVATRVGGVAELIEDRVTGLLVPPRDEKALTEALLELASDCEFRKSLGKKALAVWEKRGSPISLLKELYEIRPD